MPYRRGYGYRSAVCVRFNPLVMTGGKRSDRAVDRSWRLDGSIGEHAGDTADVEFFVHEFRGTKGTDLACKHQLIRRFGNIERLDAQRVAS